MSKYVLNEGKAGFPYEMHLDVRVTAKDINDAVDSISEMINDHAMELLEPMYPELFDYPDRSDEQGKLVVDFDDCEFYEMADRSGFSVVDEKGKQYRCCYLPFRIDGRYNEYIVAPHDLNAILANDGIVRRMDGDRLYDDEVAYFADTQDGMYYVLETIFGGEYEVTYKRKGKWNGRQG